MAGVERLEGHGVFRNGVDHVLLWNRIEFLKDKDWAEVRIASAKPDGRAEEIKTRNPTMVHLIGMIMALIVECGGDDVRTNMQTPDACPTNCVDGYVMDDDGNYERCPICRAP
jgi:hypothetical protein